MDTHPVLCFKTMKTYERPIICCLRPRHLGHEGRPAKYKGDFLKGISWQIEAKGQTRIVIEDATGHRTPLVNTALDSKHGSHRYVMPKSLLCKVKVLLESEDDNASARVVITIEDDYSMKNYRYDL